MALCVYLGKHEIIHSNTMDKKKVHFYTKSIPYQ